MLIISPQVAAWLDGDDAEKPEDDKGLPRAWFIDDLKRSFPDFWEIVERSAVQVLQQKWYVPYDFSRADPAHAQALYVLSSTALRRELSGLLGVRIAMTTPKSMVVAPLDLKDTGSRRTKDQVMTELRREYPIAYERLESLAARIHNELEEIAVDTSLPIRESDAEELRTVHAVDSYRAALEDELVVDLAFQVPYTFAAKLRGFEPAAFKAFCTVRAQLKKIIKASSK